MDLEKILVNPMHGVVSLLDEKNSQTVRSLSEKLEETFGVHPRYKTPAPHFSYLVAAEYDFLKLEDSLQKFAQKSRKFRVHAGGLGLFTGSNPVLYIPVVRTAELSRFHSSLSKSIQSVASGVARYYGPESWVPHITLAQGGVNERTLRRVIGGLSRKRLELNIAVDNLAVFRFDGKRHLLGSGFRLGSGRRMKG